MKSFKELFTDLRTFAFNKYPRWFGHKVSLTWNQYRDHCLVVIGGRSYKGNRKPINTDEPRLRTIRKDFQAFLEANDGVISVTTKHFPSSYEMLERKISTYHICFRRPESLVAFKLTFL